MMILSATLLLCLLAGAEASAIKGRHEALAAGETKRGFASPLELHRERQQQQTLTFERKELSKTAPAVIEEQRREEPLPQQKLEDLHQQREEPIVQIKQQEEPQLAPVKAPAPARAYEARPQIREEPAKGGHAKAPAKGAPAEEQLQLQQQRQEELVQLAEPQAKIEELHQQREEQLPLLSQKPLEEPLARKTAPAPAPVQAPILIPTRQEPIKGAERTQQTVHATEEPLRAKPLELTKTHEELKRDDQWVQLPEQTRLIEEQREEIHQQREEIHQQREEFERLPLAKGQREEPTKKIETIQQQQVELKHDYEQRRLEETQQVQQQQIRYEEPLQAQQQIVQVHEEQRTGAIKGASAGTAAFAEAEPYAFDYSVEGSSRRESGDVHGVVRGQYTVQNGDGSQRIVDYVADREGFRAQVNTGERGTENQQPASVVLRSSQPAAQDITLQLEGKTREFLTAVPQAPLAAPVAPTKTAPRPDNWNYEATKGHQAPAAAPAPAPVQAQRKGGDEWDSWRPAAKGKEPLAAAPILIAHQPTKSAPQRIEEAPTKQEIVRQEPLKQEPLATKQELPLKQEPIAVQQAPIKRTPKAIGAELKNSGIAQARASFESATAHRPIVHSAYPAQSGPVRYQHSQPVAAVRQPHAPIQRAHSAVAASPARHHQHLVPSRAQQLQHDRYPPQPLNPRVSFYASNFDEEQPSSSAGFDQPINSS